MGSEGRGEQIIKTDQDNALLLRDGFALDRPRRVTDAFTAALIDFGYPPCPGGIMLSHPLWRQPLAGVPRDAARLDPRRRPARARCTWRSSSTPRRWPATRRCCTTRATTSTDILAGSDAFLARFAAPSTSSARRRLVDAAAGPAARRRRRARPEEARHLPDRARRARAGAAVPACASSAPPTRLRAPGRARAASTRALGARPDRRAALPDGPEAREPTAPARRRPRARTTGSAWPTSARSSATR